ncbi:carboxypeptidase-like regulatory domain-containing protein [Pseudochelatococcus lubricantis]|uniref:carboxypeptidase-like regulatory domain-containing protein n=1 Tax=Pseudochelatococcus lubricantis TaxID=1538102 RepID=UPI0035EB9F0F
MASLAQSLAAFHQWLGEAIAPEPVHLLSMPDLSAPARLPTGGAGLLLCNVQPKTGPLGRRNIALVEVSLLLFVAEADCLKAAALAGDLAFLLEEGRWRDGAGDSQEVGLDTRDAALAMSRQCGLPPCLAMLLHVPFARERQTVAARPVLAPPRVVSEALADLHGELVGTTAAGRRLPLAEADIAVVGQQQQVRTDHRGRFHLTGLPGGRAIKLVVGFKTARHEVIVPAHGTITVEMPIDGLMQ